MVLQALKPSRLKSLLLWTCVSSMCLGCVSGPDSRHRPDASAVGQNGLGHGLAEPIQFKHRDRRMLYIVNMSLAPQSSGSARRIESAVGELSDVTTVVEHYRQASLQRVADLQPVGVILSGQGSPWDDYPRESLNGVMELVRHTKLPVLGICGGHQLIALACGGKVDRIQRLRSGKGYSGCRKESGYVAVRTARTDPVIGRVGEPLTVYESHYDEVKGIPGGFTLLASNKTSTIQAMKASGRLVYGVQFHPEHWDKQHGDGRRILARFLKLCLSDESQDVAKK